MYSSSEKLSLRQISRRGRSRLSTSTHAAANLGRDFVRDQANTVLVGVNQVAAFDLDPADHDRRTEIDESDVGVADARVQAEELESQRLHLVEVARATAGDMTDTAELLVDRRGDLAELGAQPGRVVEVLADRDFRARH